MEMVQGQPAWIIDNGEIKMSVTQLGAQMGPVIFDKRDHPFNPYFVSPWQGEEISPMASILVPLRGDFFCMPFGNNTTAFNGEHHPAHGEIAGSPWTLDGIDNHGNITSLSLSITPKVRPGTVRRKLTLIKGQPAIYSSTEICGFAGPVSFAHHANLAVPEVERTLLISTSPFKLGMVDPELFCDPINSEYQSLAIGGRFTDLTEVPSRFAETNTTDCSAFPTRYGYCDLLQMFESSQEKSRTPAWVTTVNTTDNWLWYAFKDPTLLNGRALWMENRGRHAPPWSGRTRCLGIEDGRMYFAKGLAESAAANLINSQGIPTSINLDGNPFEVRYVQGALRVPPGFGRVADIQFSTGEATFINAAGATIKVSVNHQYVFGSEHPI